MRETSIERNKTVYVIDSYNPYNKEQVKKAKKIFQINGREYAIFETELYWGKPQLNLLDDDYFDFYIYETFDEANKYVLNLKKTEGVLV